MAERQYSDSPEVERSEEGGGLAGLAVVVGVDGSPVSTHAAQWAAALAESLGAALRVVHVLPQEIVFYGEQRDTRSAYEFRESGKEIIGRVHDLLRRDRPGLEVEPMVVSGSVADVLLDLARSGRLVVVGSSDSGSAAGYLGSTAIRLAHHAQCPVLVWRGSVRDSVPDTRPVVVGVDGSAASGSAIAHAFEFAASFGARLVFVHAWKDWFGPTESESVDRTLLALAEEALLSESLAGWQEEYPDVLVDKVTERGATAEVLLSRCRDAQLLIVGSHGRGALGRALLGSTSQNMLYGAPCPTMICRDRTVLPR